MPYVRGFLQIVDRGAEIWPEPGVPTPPIAYPPEQPPGIWPSPGVPANPIVIPQPPPGMWPPLTPAHPIAPLPPTINPPLPPGEIWPPIESAPPGKFLMLVYVPGLGYKYVVVDPSLKPTPVK